MRKPRLIPAFFAFLCTSTATFAEDTFVFKEGWSVMPLPIITYSSDLGVQLGATADLTDYGKNPSVYPDFKQKIHFEASYFTKKQIFAEADYRSGSLIPGIEFSAMASYQREPLRAFYGFNGEVQTYFPSMDLNKKEGTAYYSMASSSVKAQTSLRGNMISDLDWFAGLSYWYFDNRPVNHSDYPGTSSLFSDYMSHDLIDLHEAFGGHVLELKAGMIFDTRDNPTSPLKGLNFNVLFAPGIEFGHYGKRYVNMAAHFSQYITPFKGGWLTIAYHLAYQGTVAGAAPYYLLSYLYSPDALHCFSEGLGGDGTIRGMIRRRMVADGYAWGNLDLRLRFATLPIPGGFIAMGADPFCDAGVIVQPHKVKEMAAMQGISEADVMRLARKVQVSVGCGLNLNVSNTAMISFSLAKSLTNRDTRLGLYLSAGYMF